MRLGQDAAPRPCSVDGVERERDGLVRCQRPALLPGFGEESFVQFGLNDGERLFIPLDHPRTTDAELLSQRLRAGKEAHGSVRLPGEGERRRSG